jgi:hypothetical protein
MSSLLKIVGCFSGLIYVTEGETNLPQRFLLNLAKNIKNEGIWAQYYVLFMHDQFNVWKIELIFTKFGINLNPFKETPKPEF